MATMKVAGYHSERAQVGWLMKLKGLFKVPKVFGSEVAKGGSGEFERPVALMITLKASKENRRPDNLQIYTYTL